MLSRLVLLLTAPLLLYQGRRVRRTTPRLPEPPGDRAGCTRQTDKPILRLLLLGDSAIAGVGSTSQQEAVTGQLTRLLAEQYDLQWQLIARSSLTCAQVLELLRESQLDMPQVDAVLVSVGVNDVTRRTTLRQWREDLRAMTSYLVEVLGAQSVLYTALPPMHKFPALPQPLRWFVGQQAQQLNHALTQHCRQQTQTELLNFDVPYEPKYIATDGYHPSAVAAQIWAQKAVRQLMKKHSDKGVQ
ncbi:SGNH/GDSL hydrolase family protein [Pseudidiomarina salilacus]|uniref:SGNH/GDSL hydrolase family protein n=1 Tax=Pseudidiomarina salilacus TaxID=3384452 RepID=UPI003984BEDC